MQEETLDVIDEGSSEEPRARRRVFHVARRSSGAATKRDWQLTRSFSGPSDIEVRGGVADGVGTRLPDKVVRDEGGAVEREGLNLHFTFLRLRTRHAQLTCRDTFGGLADGRDTTADRSFPDTQTKGAALLTSRAALAFERRKKRHPPPDTTEQTQHTVASV